MNEPQNEMPAQIDAPEPVVRQKKRIGLVWLIPVVAALVGAWLAVKAVTEAGPTITITFKSAEGLEAGKTKIKYKDVAIGQVESIRLSNDLSLVTVSAKMVNEIEDHLTENTRFWVVRARVAAGQVSGLGTLFSGAYIGMDPGQRGNPAEHFKGLETPPVVTMDTPGTYFNLQADRLGSLHIGAPVYFRQIKVGQVVSYKMTEDGSSLDIQIFIQAPHNERVRQNTRFWNTSGLDVTIDTQGVRIDTESLTTLLIGGVAFETPTNLEPGAPAVEGQTFTLHANRAKIDEPAYLRKEFVVAYFDETVRGLSKGAPVEFRGIRIGEVIDVKLEFSQQQLSFRIPVLMAIEPERVSIVEEKSVDPELLITQLIEKGLRAQLRTGILLTGQLYVNLSMHPEAPTRSLEMAGPYPIIPSIPGRTEEITSSVANFLNRLEKLPLEQISADLRDSMKQVRHLVYSEDLVGAVKALNKSLDQLGQFTTKLNTDTAPQLSEILEQTRLAVVQTQETLLAAEHMVSAEAPLTYELQQMIQELAKAGRAVATLADYLERHPEALIYGKGEPSP